jgi:hypothetical protein
MSRTINANQPLTCSMPQELLDKAAAIHICNPELWGARISIGHGQWYQMFYPRVQHLVPTPPVMPLLDQYGREQPQASLLEPPTAPPLSYRSPSHREGWRDEAEYWQHLAHDDASFTEFVFEVSPETLDPNTTCPLRWHVGDHNLCTVQLVLRLPINGPILSDNAVLLQVDYAMDMVAYPSSEKPYHNSMILQSKDFTAEIEFHSRADTVNKSGFFYHPTQASFQIQTDVLIYLMAKRNAWFKAYMQALGVLPRGG